MQRLTVMLTAAVLVLTGCGRDDGSQVRTIDATDGGGSISGSVSGTGSASASGSGSGVAATGCEVIGGVAAAEAEVHVTLDEWSIAADPMQAVAGVVTFEAENVGEEAHELVIARADEPSALPTDGSGAVDEAALGEENFIGEIEAFPPGQTCEGSFELDAGDYVLFCAIVEEENGQVENHYELGMAASFTVREG